MSFMCALSDIYKSLIKFKYENQIKLKINCFIKFPNCAIKIEILFMTGTVWNPLFDLTELANHWTVKDFTFGWTALLTQVFVLNHTLQWILCVHSEFHPSEQVCIMLVQKEKSNYVVTVVVSH